nr:multidrug and toxin extrusion protein 1-like [Crassostrea gigas]
MTPWRSMCCCTGNGYKQEFIELLKMAWPMALTQFLMFLPVFVSQGFCGHLGKDTIDGVALASTIINVTGMCVLLGLSSAVDTLFSQTFGSGNQEKVGIILQKGIWILMLSCLPCWAVFLNAGIILQAIGQDKVVSRVAEEYATVFIAGLPGYGLNILLSKYIQVQSIVIPSLLIGLIINLLNGGFHALFIYVFEMNTRGAALAAVLTHWSSVLFHVLFITCKGYYKTTWTGWSKESFNDWGHYVKLAIPGLLMICMEFWGLEIIVLLSGYLGKADLAANTIGYYTGGLSYMIIFGMSLAAGMRIGLLLGAGDSEQARIASRVALCCNLIIAFVIAILFASLKDYIPKIFSSDADVLELASPVMLQLAIYKVFDTTQANCGGILRGIGLHAFGAIFNFIGYYVITLPISIPLMLRTHLGVSGAWWGMIVGSFTVSVIYLIKIFTIDWEKEAEKALERAGVNRTDIDTKPIIEHDELKSIRMTEFSDENKSYKSMNDVQEPFNESETQSSYHKNVLSKILCLTFLIIIFFAGLCIRIFVDIGLI